MTLLKQPKSKTTRRFLYAASICFVITVAAGVYFSFKYVDDASSEDYGSSTSASGDTPLSDQTQTSGSTSSPKDSSSAAPSLDTSVTPVAPAGTFVSNHRPNLSGSPAPSQENSTCTTTPGAECYIQFENDGVIKLLPAQVTDSNGNTSWDWDVKSLGLSQGSWTITAIAKNGAKTNSSGDEIRLQVQP